MIRSTGVLLGARLFSGAATFVVLAAIARMMSREEVAVFIVAFSLSIIIASIGDLGLGMLAVREGAREPRSIGYLAGAILTLRIALAIPLLALGAITAGVLFGTEFVGVTTVATLAALFMFASATGRAFFQARERFGTTAVAIVLENVAWVVAVLVVAWLTRSPVMAFGAAALIFAGSTLLTFAVVLTGASRSDIVAGIRAAPRVAVRSAGFAAFVTIGVIQAQIDTLIAGLMLPIIEVAAVGVALRLFLSADYISEAVSRASYPGLSRAAGTAPHATSVDKLALLLAGSGAVVGSVLAVIAATLVVGIFGAEYDDAVAPLTLLAASVPLRYLAAAYGLALTTVGHQGARAVALGIAVAVGAAVDVAAIHILGPIGIAVGVWVSAVMLLLLGLGLMAQVPLRIQWITVGVAGAASVLIAFVSTGLLGVVGPVLAAGLGALLVARSRPDRPLVS